MIRFSRTWPRHRIYRWALILISMLLIYMGGSSLLTLTFIWFGHGYDSSIRMSVLGQVVIGFFGVGFLVTGVMVLRRLGSRPR